MKRGGEPLSSLPHNPIKASRATNPQSGSPSRGEGPREEGAAYKGSAS